LGSLGGTLEITNSTLVVNPFRSLASSTSYYVNIDPTALVDKAGNYFEGIQNSTSLNFTTSASSGAPDATAPSFNNSTAFVFTVSPYDQNVQAGGWSISTQTAQSKRSLTTTVIPTITPTI
jgi:hypothetical protein